MHLLAIELRDLEPRMKTPTVSFVVPCYNLADLLPECIASILSQTYTDFEVLIMDDCSPDETPKVARSFNDSRVRHIRNDPNLGHLRNYNRGIGLAQGKYVWLISADDYLRTASVLARYVRLLEDNPKVGYVFCPGFGVWGGVEDESANLGSYPNRGNDDCIVPGHVLLKKLLKSNFVLAASGMARRACYERNGLFPLDMPWAGDWYLWCLFALHWDVGYFSEPMVCYRKHDRSMTSFLMHGSAGACFEEDVAVVWAIKEKADAARMTEVSRECLSAEGHIYARNIASERHRAVTSSSTLEAFENALRARTANPSEQRRVRASVYAGMGNEYYWQGKPFEARAFYSAALCENRFMADVRVKRLLLSFGKAGDFLRKAIMTTSNPR